MGWLIVEAREETISPTSEDTVLKLIVRIARLFYAPDDFWDDELDVHDPLAS
jgi:hypothetical protein